MTGPRRPPGVPSIPFDLSAHEDRPAHTQLLRPITTSLAREPFSSTQFVAYLSGKDMKFSPTGGLIFTLNVNRDHTDRALKLREVFALPLSVDIQVWEPYTDMQAEQEKKYPPHA